jgi:hypothetical protein
MLFYLHITVQMTVSLAPRSPGAYQSSLIAS